MSPHRRRRQRRDGRGHIELRDPTPRRLAQKSLARRAHEHRATQAREPVDFPQELPVVGVRLAEPDPRVERDPAARHAQRLDRVRAAGQPVAHLFHHVVVSRVDLHRERRASHMHQDDRRSRFGDDSRHIGVARHPRHVVHDRGAGLESPASDFSLRRIHRDRNAASRRSRLHHRDHPFGSLHPTGPVPRPAGSIRLPRHERYPRPSATKACAFAIAASS